MSNTKRSNRAPNAIAMTAADASGASTAPSNPAQDSVTPAAAPNLDQIASDLIGQLKTLIASIPELELTYPLGRKRLRSTSSIPIAFVFEAAKMVESQAPMQELERFDLPGFRHAAGYEAQFQPMVRLLERAAADLQYTIDTKMAGAATQALQIYAVGKSLSRDKGGAALLSHIDAMKKALGRRGNRSRRNAPPAEAATENAAPVTPAAAPTSLSITATIPAAPTTK